MKLEIELSRIELSPQSELLCVSESLGLSIFVSWITKIGSSMGM